MAFSMQAYRDVIHSPKWMLKLFIAALVNLVPILNLSNCGYFAEWAATGANESKQQGQTSTPLPAYHISGATFRMGFFIFLIGLVAGVAIAIVRCIPVVGEFLAIAALVFACPFSGAMAIRCALKNSLGEGFQLKTVWGMFRKKMGGLFDATYLPMLIIIVVGELVSALYAYCLMYLVGVPALTEISATAFLNVLVAMNALGWLITAVYAVIISWLMMLISAITFRALGLWAASLS